MKNKNIYKTDSRFYLIAICICLKYPCVMQETMQTNKLKKLKQNILKGIDRNVHYYAHLTDFTEIIYNDEIAFQKYSIDVRALMYEMFYKNIFDAQFDKYFQNRDFELIYFANERKNLKFYLEHQKRKGVVA